jgi:hypothetical protein
MDELREQMGDAVEPVANAPGTQKAYSNPVALA